MRTLVLGAAVSGRAAARLAIRAGQRVTVWDADPAAAASLTSEGIPAVGGSWNADLLEGVDLVVVSPGIQESALPIVETLESRVPLWSEVEFAWRQLEVPVVAVTGTNGKTTVTTLIADMLGRSGVATVAAGNIGTALSDVVRRRLGGRRGRGLQLPIAIHRAVPSRGCGAAQRCARPPRLARLDPRVHRGEGAHLCQPGP